MNATEDTETVDPVVINSPAPAPRPPPPPLSAPPAPPLASTFSICRSSIATVPLATKNARYKLAPLIVVSVDPPPSIVTFCWIGGNGPASVISQPTAGAVPHWNTITSPLAIWFNAYRRSPDTPVPVPGGEPGVVSPVDVTMKPAAILRGNVAVVPPGVATDTVSVPTAVLAATSNVAVIDVALLTVTLATVMFESETATDVCSVVKFVPVSVWVNELALELVVHAFWLSLVSVGAGGVANVRLAPVMEPEIVPPLTDGVIVVAWARFPLYARLTLVDEFVTDVGERVVAPDESLSTRFIVSGSPFVSA